MADRRRLPDSGDHLPADLSDYQLAAIRLENSPGQLEHGPPPPSDAPSRRVAQGDDVPERAAREPSERGGPALRIRENHPGLVRTPPKLVDR